MATDEVSDKRCCTCGYVRPRADFNKRAKARDGLQDRCRECSRAWYLEHRVEHRANTKRRKAEAKAFLRDQLRLFLLAHPCVDCGEADLRVLEFDHRDPSTKVSTIGKLMDSVAPWHVVTAEMAKCDVRCAHCHRRRTCTEGGWWRHEAEAERRAEVARKEHEQEEEHLAIVRARLLWLFPASG